MQTPKDKAIQNLANAIIVQAAEDYRNALRGKGYGYKPSPDKIIREIEYFFRSDWFHTLTKVDGEYLLERLKKEVASEGGQA